MQELSSRYPVWFCDIWGVVHNGMAPFPPAIDALNRHRHGGGIVVLVSNSPRSSAGVERQLQGLGVDPASHDAVVTSGDVTRVLVENHGCGKVYHLGPERGLSLFQGLSVTSVPLAEAHAVLCTGLFDDMNERPEDYAPLLAELRKRSLVMICANPDKTVRYGDRLIYCAGSLADAYAAIGGEVLMAGKPYRPIYDLAMKKAEEVRGSNVDLEQVLAIGDGPETDIKGAVAYGIDAVLVAEDENEAANDARIIATVPRLAWS